MTRIRKSASVTLSRAAFLVALLAAVGCAAGTGGPAVTTPAAPAPARFASLDGTRVRYESFGEGREAIVFVHGWAGDASVWRFQVPEFAKRARVIALDLPGHGASDKPQTTYTMDLFARSVEAVMRDAGVDRAVLVGHSMGTPVVRQFFRLFPQKTLALVAVDGSLRNMFTDQKQVEGFLAPFRGPGYQEQAAKFIGAMFPNPGTEALRDATVATVLATPQHVMVGSFEGMLEPGIWTDDPIRVPLLVVNAKFPYWTPEYEAYVRKLAPHVDYRVIDGPGHFLMLEKPQEFNAAILDFLRKQKLPGG
jgi:pimeloyl-ACP methyl ester carboxylesterase